MIAGRTRSLARNVGATAGPQQFYRALQTEGLYDPSLFRTVSLTLTQANWGALLTTARITGSNVYCFLVTLDNGADRSYAITAADADVWSVQTPSPGTANQCPISRWERAEPHPTEGHGPALNSQIKPLSQLPAAPAHAAASAGTCTATSSLGAPSPAEFAATMRTRTCAVGVRLSRSAPGSSTVSTRRKSVSTPVSKIST